MWSLVHYVISVNLVQRTVQHLLEIICDFGPHPISKIPVFHMDELAGAIIDVQTNTAVIHIDGFWTTLLAR